MVKTDHVPVRGAPTMAEHGGSRGDNPDKKHAEDGHAGPECAQRQHDAIH